MTGLFQLFPDGFKAHSGATLFWKIEADALIGADWDALAWILAQRLLPFERVIGIPTGGDRLALPLGKHAKPGSGRLVIADDVLTTGGSMEQAKVEALGDGRSHRGVIYWSPLRSRTRVREEDILGAVAFARARPASWIMAAFAIGDLIEPATTRAVIVPIRGAYEDLEGGWYWSLPNGHPLEDEPRSGPWPTEAEAIAAAERIQCEVRS